MPGRTSRPSWMKTAAGEAALSSPLPVARAPRGMPEIRTATGPLEPSTRSRKSAGPPRPAETRLGLTVRLKEGAGGGGGFAGGGGCAGSAADAVEASKDESASQAGFGRAVGASQAEVAFAISGCAVRAVPGVDEDPLHES